MMIGVLDGRRGMWDDARERKRIAERGIGDLETDGRTTRGTEGVTNVKTRMTGGDREGMSGIAGTGTMASANGMRR
jgi:hypothetical protein